MALLEEGAREALSDVVARVLRRNISDGRDEDLDCTLLTWAPPHRDTTTTTCYTLSVQILVNTCQPPLCAVIFYNKWNEWFINNFTRLEILILKMQLLMFRIVNTIAKQILYYILLKISCNIIRFSYTYFVQKNYIKIKSREMKQCIMSDRNILLLKLHWTTFVW